MVLPTSGASATDPTQVSERIESAAQMQSFRYVGPVIRKQPRLGMYSLHLMVSC